MSARRGILTCVLFLACAAWLAAAGQAAARVVHEREGSFALGGVNFVAVDNSAGPAAGDLYIGESRFGSLHSRVFQTDPSGTPTGVELDGAETPAGSFGMLDTPNSRVADGPAVDGSTGARAEDVYVPDFVHSVVDLFDEEGGYLCQITGAATPSPSECAGASGSETPLGGLQPLSVSVDPGTGTLAVGDARGVVYEFDEEGRFEGEIADPHITVPGSIAFDSTGSLYVVDESIFTGTGEAVKFSPGGGFEGVIADGRSSVGVDVGNDHVYLGSLAGDPIEEFDPAGGLVSTFGEAALSIDAAGPSGRVYVTPLSGEGEIWGPGVFLPTLSTGAATEVGVSTATVSGHLDPELGAGGTPVGSCEFEYGETDGYGQHAPCSPAPPYSNPTDVSADLGGLKPSTAYDYRLVAANTEGTARGENGTFTTSGPPGIEGETAIARTTSATVSAQINPFGFETSCRVQYVDDPTFRLSGYVGAAAVPCAEALPAGFANRTATASLTGLRIGAAYHFRFVATNQAGTGIGEDAGFSTFAIESFSLETLDEEGLPYTQAGGHPYAMKVVITLATTSPLSRPNPRSASANVRTIQVELPPGLIGNPTAAPRCQAMEMKPQECPAATQVGLATIFSPRGTSEFGPVYNLAGPAGVAAELGARFNAFGTARIDAGVRSGSDYGVSANSVFLTADEAIERIEMTLWGVPASPLHFGERFCRGEILPNCASEAPLLPFLTDPTACEGPLASTLRIDSWQAPGEFVDATAPMPPRTGCDALDFNPSIRVEPDVRSYESPTGLHVDLHVPQNSNPYGLAEANLKDATVTLPPGMTVNPAGANGLAACSAAQIDLHAADPAACPDAAKIGDVEVDTPLLDHPLAGAVYVASPHENPFGSLLAIYLAVDDPRSGVVVKLAGKVTPDPQTGQLTARFAENPQLPFEDIKLDLFGGDGAALMTPQACGEAQTTTALSPWSGGAEAHPSDSMRLDAGPHGLPCIADPSQAPDSPRFSAGAVTPLAGAYSPFVLHLERADGTQRLGRVGATLPAGELARLAGVPYCPLAALERVPSRSGREEQAEPSCPQASRVGGVDVGVGAGERPYHVQGSAYLAGPYRGAPISLAIVTPAVAGPFDLGTVLVRVAVFVDPESARVRAESDPLPRILEGIPLDIRSVALALDRPRFTLDPTSCDSTAVEGEIEPAFGPAVTPASRFQVGGCGALGFRPHLKLRLGGSTRRTGHPALRAVVDFPKDGGQANVARAQVGLPGAEFLDQGNLGRVCTRPGLLEGRCPRSTIYGHAKAWTPLLAEPLEGPVYLVGGFGYRLPALIADLRGQIRILLRGRIDSTAHHGIRATFETVPDAPVTRFVLQMKGGRRFGLLQNSRGLCGKPLRASALLSAHDGERLELRPRIHDRCPNKGPQPPSP